ncbi:MAG TPA: sugar transferase [Capsulimonadaceae bacterium]|jgi:lipopolysaccharide/colanic/teichoic acid biosynthesis glycosyltransferase
MQRLVKRAADIAIASFLFAFFLPLLVLAAIGVKLTSRGPLFYKQQRVGYKGREFSIIKFRTMCIDADRNGPSVTAADDTRITPYGRFMRKSKLDELPQLINVIRGDMSLVGPRPQVPAFVAHFDPAQKKIALSVLPGVTGVTALCFRNEEIMLANKENREEYYISRILPVKLELDVWYVENCGVVKDLFLLWNTAWLLAGSVFRSLSGRVELDHDEKRIARIVKRYVDMCPGSDFPEMCDPTRIYRIYNAKPLTEERLPTQRAVVGAAGRD